MSNAQQTHSTAGYIPEQLKARLADLVAKAQGIRAKAEAEKREPTAQEQGAIDAICAKFDGVDVLLRLFENA